jgi:RNA polymerase sigma-70 factor (ECF subfamily)
VRGFIETFQGPVFGLCLRMLGHRQDAEDVTQEVLFRAIRHLAHWDSKRRLGPWLFTIAANRCRTFLSLRSRQQPVAGEFQEAESPRPPGMAFDFRQDLQEALNSLREEFRACFVMFYQQEMSISEIAAAVKAPEGTIKTWLHRARSELAKRLRGDWWQSDGEDD